MLLQKFVRQKIFAAGMAGPRDECHPLRHVAVRGFSLHRAARIEGIPSPFLDTAGRVFNVAAERALIRLRFLRGGLLGAVGMVAEKFLSHSYVDLSLVLFH